MRLSCRIHSISCSVVAAPGGAWRMKIKLFNLLCRSFSFCLAFPFFPFWNLFLLRRRRRRRNEERRIANFTAQTSLFLSLYWFMKFIDCLDFDTFFPSPHNAWCWPRSRTKSKEIREGKVFRFSRSLTSCDDNFSRFFSFVCDYLAHSSFEPHKEIDFTILSSPPVATYKCTMWKKEKFELPFPPRSPPPDAIRSSARKVNTSSRHFLLSQLTGAEQTPTEGSETHKTTEGFMW